MIVLGPMDADLGGAPSYWRRGNWRPAGPDRDAATRSLTVVPTIPFDRCDIVLVYDAADLKRPLPEEQGWEVKASAGGPVHLASQGALRLDAPAGEELWFYSTVRASTTNVPDHAVVWALFAVEDTRGDRPDDDKRQIGFDLQVLANREGEPFRGLRATWSNRFVWRSLGRGERVKEIDASVPHDTLTEVWHGVAIDGRLTGFKTLPSDDNLSVPDDGGLTIGGLDGLINNEPRSFFGVDTSADPPASFSARFGKTDPAGSCRVWIRRVVASAYGRWLVAAFRAAAPGTAVRLRLVLYADIPEDGADGAAAFLIRYASGSDVRPNERPTSEVTISRQFDSTNFHRVVEAAVDLKPFRPGAPLWFSVERDWRNESDKLRATVHLLQVILEAI